MKVVEFFAAAVHVLADGGGFVQGVDSVILRRLFLIEPESGQLVLASTVNVQMGELHIDVRLGDIVPDAARPTRRQDKAVQ
jgi:hypothetical protein